MAKTTSVKAVSGTRGNQSIATVQTEDGNVTLKGPAWEGEWANKRQESVDRPHPLSFIGASGVREMPLWWDR